MADDLTTACIAAVAAIVGGLVTGAYGHGRDYFRRPILKIDYGKNPAADKVIVKYKYQGQDVEDIIIRARLTNTGKTPAKQCRVFLTSVKEVGINNKQLETDYFDSKPLAWPGWEFEPRDIPPGVIFYVEVVGVFKHVAG